MTLLAESFIKRDLVTRERHEAYLSTNKLGEKTLHIEIALDKIAELKSNGFNLCFAKTAKDSYGHSFCNVVWHSYRNFFVNTIFSWTPLYYLFAGASFKEFAAISTISTSNAVKIRIGEQATLDTSGKIGNVVSGNNHEGITLINECPDIGGVHPGLLQTHSDLNLETISAPNCLLDKKLFTGSLTLIPQELLMVWLDQNLETGTLFQTIRPPSIEVNMSDIAEAHLLYDGQWQQI